MTNARIGDLAIPPGLLSQIQAVAAAEHRAVGDVLRDVIEHGLEERWQAHANRERQRAHDLGSPDDDTPLTPEYRDLIRREIAQGVRSLQEGRVVDGPSFMARMDQDLAEGEPQHEGR